MLELPKCFYAAPQDMVSRRVHYLRTLLIFNFMNQWYAEKSISLRSATQKIMQMRLREFVSGHFVCSPS